MRRLLIALACLVVFPVQAWATVATSCSQLHVQEAITATATGGTVTVPACPSGVTWTTRVEISGKRLKLVGAGIGQTVITVGTTDYGLLLTVSATNFVEVSGFTFIRTQVDNLILISIWGVEDEVGFRIHHCRFWDNGLGALSNRAIWPVAAYGLIDYNEFDVDNLTNSEQQISISGSNQGSDGGFTQWTRPLTMGSDKAVYVENCTFTVANQREDVIDGFSGARIVVRNNSFSGTSVGFHGTDSGLARSPVSVELYNNIFTNNSGTARRATTNRGGTAVYFNNTYGGTTAWNGLYLYYYRALYYQAGPDSWGMCDGTQWDIGSAVLSDTASRIAVPAGTGVRFLASNPDTISAAGTRYLDGSGPYGYPCRDQPGRGPNGQLLAPVYGWNNGSVTIGPGAADAGAPATVDNWMLENRDYYNYTAGFNGTVGVGRGTKAAMLAITTCTTGVAYWVTDEAEWASGTDINGVNHAGVDGQLYTCSAPNTWTVYYTPYTYPHPLAGAASAPNAPTNVRIR